MAFRRWGSRRNTRRYNRFVPRPVKNFVRKAIDNSSENKIQYASLTNTFNSISTNWIELSMSAIQQGTEMWQRTGRTIRLRSLEIKAVMSAGADELLTDDAYNVVRVVVGYYNNKTTTPLQTGSASLDTPITPRLCSNGQLIKKYMDKYMALEVTSTEKGAGDGYTPGVKILKYFKKFSKPITLYFNGSAAADGQNQLMIAMLADSAAITNPGIVAGWYKVTFEDA